MSYQIGDIIRPVNRLQSYYMIVGTRLVQMEEGKTIKYLARSLRNWDRLNEFSKEWVECYTVIAQKAESCNLY